MTTERPLAARQPLSVTEVSERAKALLEGLGFIRVSGEISNHRPSGGHHYFTLKDAQCALPAVLFRREATRSRVQLRDGLTVTVLGRLTVYGPSGRYQIVCEAVDEAGEGLARQQFEALKAKLAAEGLFERERKRRLPLLPDTVAVITSPTGAVLRDFVRVAQRRFPKARVLLVPVRVQGLSAVPEIVDALERVGSAAVSTVVLARGGGSAEDLAAYNDEKVVRAMANCPIPVVSAVGHETDVTLADFVADVRAGTPSIAAELVFPDWYQLKDRALELEHRLTQSLRRQIVQNRTVFALRSRFMTESRPIVRWEQRLVEAIRRFGDAARSRLATERTRYARFETRLRRAHPAVRVAEWRGRLNGIVPRLRPSITAAVARKRARLQAEVVRLRVMSPLSVLERGYAVAQTDEGTVIREAAHALVGQRVHVRVALGRLSARVEEVVESGPVRSVTEET